MRTGGDYENGSLDKVMTKSKRVNEVAAKKNTDGKVSTVEAGVLPNNI
jgi:hypothetical protein